MSVRRILLIEPHPAQVEVGDNTALVIAKRDIVSRSRLESFERWAGLLKTRLLLAGPARDTGEGDDYFKETCPLIAIGYIL